MLEGMRKRSRSVLIWTLFGIIIAVFIISFGPQSQGGCSGMGMGGGKDDQTAADVAGASLAGSAFRATYALIGGPARPPQQQRIGRLKEMVMDRLIERELLAEEARKNGFVVTEDDVHKLLLDGRVMLLGGEQPIPRLKRDGVFNYDQFKSFVQYELQLSPATFIEQQQRELLAQRMRELLRASVQVSPDEVKAEYESRSRQVNLEYLRFPSRKFEAAVEPSAQEIAAYVAANEAKLKEAFEQRKPMYSELPAEVRVRRILLKPAASEKEGAAKKKRMQDIADRVNKGEPVADAARALPKEPAGAAPASADLGWKRKGSLGLETADDDQVFAAAAGKAVGPIKTADGLAVFVVTSKREGTLTFDQVKAELAEEKLKQEKAPALAKQKAEEALAVIKASPDKTLKELFPAPKSGEKAGEKAGEDEGRAGGGTAATDDDPLRARAEETGLFHRRGSMVEAIGDSPALAKAAFDLKPDAPVAGPFDVQGSQVVVRLKERKDPDAKELEVKRPELTREAELVKWSEVLTEFVRSRCLSAKKADKIQVNRHMLKYEEADELPAYEVCSAPPRRPAS
jgi:peptidyl-prolyl cis-trans isomerase D